VLAMPDARWGERPLAVVEVRPGRSLDEAALRAFLQEKVAEGRIARWWIPDRFEFVGKIPLTSAGKLHKTALKKALGLTE